MIAEIYQLRACLAQSEQREVVVLIVLSVVAGGSEFVAIGALVPLLAGLIGSLDLGGGPFDRVQNLIPAGGDPFSVLAALVVSVTIISATLRFALVWRSERFCARMGSDLVQGIYTRVMREDVAVFDARNSSEVLAVVDKVQGVEHGFVRPLLAAAISGIIGVCMLVLLLIIAPLLTAILIALMGLAYLAVSKLSVPYIRRYARDMSQGWSSRTRLLRESLGAKREIMLARSFAQFEAGVLAADIQFREAQARNQTFAQAPRTVFQSSIIIALVGAAMAVGYLGGQLSGMLPVFASAAIALQRLLPLAQAVWNGTVQATGNRELVRDVIRLRCEDLTPAPVKPHARFDFTHQLECNDVEFAYDGCSNVLDNVSLTIQRGEWVGISGPSGSGKSTLLDLLMGFRQPSCGTVRVDGEVLAGVHLQRWQKGIGFVREASFLLDGSIKDNIAFGEAAGDLCPERLAKIASLTGLDPLIVSLEGGMEASIGECGIKLSAGQRQRIAIARALYREPAVLILDEGTNAIDTALETVILANIAKAMPELTLILVTHRLQSMARCTQRFEVTDRIVTQMLPGYGANSVHFGR